MSINIGEILLTLWNDSGFAAIISGFGAAVKTIDHSNIEHIIELNKHLRDKLSSIDGIVVNSDNKASPYILNISVLGYRSETLLHFLEARDIYVSSGSACAKGKGSHVLGAMELDRKRIDSALRISFSKDNTNEDIDTVLKTLTPREEAVIRLRFGLKDGRCHTLEEVGTEFHVTRERIRQIEAKALRKLRHPSRSRKLKDYLE